MKKLLKVLLPPFVSFLLFFLVIRYSSLYFTLRLDEMGGGTLRSFMAFYRYTLPLLFVVAILTQLLIFVPAWDRLRGKPKANKINFYTDLVFICIFFALGISYTIWDPQDTLKHFEQLALLMTVIQLFYWLINIWALLIIE